MKDQVGDFLTQLAAKLELVLLKSLWVGCLQSRLLWRYPSFCNTSVSGSKSETIVQWLMV